MTDGTPNLTSMTPTSTSQQKTLTIPTTCTNTDASRHDDPSAPHALLHATAAAGLSNQHNAASNTNIDFSFPSIEPSASASASFFSDSKNNSPVQFRSHTIAPSPPPGESPPPSDSASSRWRDSAASGTENSSPPGYNPSPLSIITAPTSNPPSYYDNDRRDSTSSLRPTTPTRPSASALSGVIQRKASTSSLHPVSRTPSFKTTPYSGGLGHSFGTPSGANSAYPSPLITAMGDITPLPSPLMASDSPGPWKRIGGRPPSRDATSPRTPQPDSVLISSAGESIAAALANHTKRKAYSGLALELQDHKEDGGEGTNDGSPASSKEYTTGGTTTGHLPKPPTTVIHGRNRSVSEYTPDPMLLPKRMSTVTGSRGGRAGETAQLELQQKPQGMRREPHLSASRGLTPAEKPPTPPPSESSLTAADLSSSSSASISGPSSDTPTSTPVASEGKEAASAPRYEYFEAHRRRDGKLRRWRAVKLLGQGTFSRVMLATSSKPGAVSEFQNGSSEDVTMGNSGEEPKNALPRDRKKLVAIKVCEHGPKGGASEDRIEMSLKRELEIMRSIRHPSLVHLLAWNIEPTRAVLVLSYCQGGDLFDVATAHRDVLTPGLLRRIFAEQVGAVRYLHDRHIVHRDIKLENILINIPPDELRAVKDTMDWTTYPYPVSTLTDLGLSRRVADDEKLETRCGSDDYAAPEVIMGQPYDGQAVDAWSLGVLLYALIESRLPFDPMPGNYSAAEAHRMRSRTSHRIARIEWRWVQFAGEDGDHEGDEAMFKAKGLHGAMVITEGLLKRARSRWPLSKVAEEEWVRDAIKVEGGMKFREEDEGEGVERGGLN